MQHSNSKKLKSQMAVSIPLIKSRLTLRLVDDIVHIHESSSDREWDTSREYASMLLACSVQGNDDTRMMALEDNIFEESDLRVFDGWFPVDQIIFQQLRMHYDVCADQKARARSQFRPDLFLSVQHAQELPAMEQVRPKPGDFISCWNEEEGAHRVLIYKTPAVKPSDAKTDRKIKFIAMAAVVVLALCALLSLQHSEETQRLQASGPKELSIHCKS